jgi:hypothetical protein
VHAISNENNPCVETGWMNAHFTKICMPPRRRRTKCRVDSFWML